MLVRVCSWFVSSGIKQHAICTRVIRLLRRERVRRGVSKYQLSAQTGLAQQTLSYIERGLRQPSFETILRIADGIGISLEKVLKMARGRTAGKAGRSSPGSRRVVSPNRFAGAKMALKKRLRGSTRR